MHYNKKNMRNIDGTYSSTYNGTNYALRITGNSCFLWRQEKHGEKFIIDSYDKGVCSLISCHNENRIAWLNIKGNFPDIGLTLPDSNILLLFKKIKENKIKNGFYFRYYCSDPELENTDSFIEINNSLATFKGSSIPGLTCQFITYNNLFIMIADPSFTNNVPTEAYINKISELTDSSFTLGNDRICNKYIFVDAQFGYSFEDCLVGFKDMGDSYSIINMRYDNCTARGKFIECLPLSQCPTEFTDLVIDWDSASENDLQKELVRRREEARLHPEKTTLYMKFMYKYFPDLYKELEHRFVNNFPDHLNL